jgi:hypothetical protein
MFVCVLSFANLESTLSLILSGRSAGYAFDFREVCLTYAFIGLVLAVVQGAIVRPLSTRVSEPVLATAGTLIEITGFFVLARAASHPSLALLLFGLGVVVTGFACMTPALNALLSRWTDPAKQGGILGIGQSISSLARILGPMAGVPLVENQALASRLGVNAAAMPLLLAAALMTVGLALIVVAASRGRDWRAASERTS